MKDQPKHLPSRVTWCCAPNLVPRVSIVLDKVSIVLRFQGKYFFFLWSVQLNPNCRVQPRPQDLSLVLGLGREEAKGTSAEGKGEVLETRMFTVLFFKKQHAKKMF